MNVFNRNKWIIAIITNNNITIKFASLPTYSGGVKAIIHVIIAAFLENGAHRIIYLLLEIAVAAGSICLFIKLHHSID